METEYIVVGAKDMIFDIVGRLRAANCEVALVTADGNMSHPREVQGVLTLSDVARSSRLARQMERQRSPRVLAPAKTTPAGRPDAEDDG